MNSFGLILSCKFRGMIEMSASPVTEAVRKALIRLGVIPSSTVLVGVSGGIDSMVLLAVLHSLGIDCTASHVNFQLRGEESDADEAFVRQWCQQNNIKCITIAADTLAYVNQHNVNIQSGAREIRYKWWDKLINKDKQYDFLATAHHGDDNAETFFINLLRGSGLKGLKGIPAKRDAIIRPLLLVSKKEIEDFATAFEIPFRTDSSNIKDDYQRNRIRHHLMPVIKDLTHSSSALLKQSFLRLNVEWNAWDKAYLQWQTKNVIDQHGTYQLFVSEGEQAFVLKFLEEHDIPWTLAYDYVFAEAYAMNQPLQYGEYLLSRTGSGFYLNKSTDFHSVQIDQPGKYTLPGGHLIIEFIERDKIEFNDNPNDEYVNAESIEWPLSIRKVSEGDRFHPLGMNGNSKKLQDFLTDLKLDSHQKAGTYVLTSADQIVWVVGMRLDDRFKVTGENQAVYKLTFRPA